jgi:hypothetical protein
MIGAYFPVLPGTRGFSIPAKYPRDDDETDTSREEGFSILEAIGKMRVFLSVKDLS